MFAQTITAFSPTSGNVGTLITLSGTNLELVTAVAINGTAGVLVAKTSTSVSVLVMPGTTSGHLTATGGAPAATSATNFIVTGTALNAVQQGPKLVGTDAIGAAQQSSRVALSTDGTTLAVGGSGDNTADGATWVFTRNGTSWSQQGPKLVGTGSIRNAYQGCAVALSADGTTLAEGGYGDNSGAGAAWVFSTASSSPLAHSAAAVPRVGASFFPNPVTELFTLNAGPLGSTLRLLDNMGRSVLAGTYRDGQPLGLSTLATGCRWTSSLPNPCLSARTGVASA